MFLDMWLCTCVCLCALVVTDRGFSCGRWQPPDTAAEPSHAARGLSGALSVRFHKCDQRFLPDILYVLPVKSLGKVYFCKHPIRQRVSLVQFRLLVFAPATSETAESVIGSCTRQRKHPFAISFLVFVPSLSWQMIAFRKEICCNKR